MTGFFPKTMELFARLTFFPVTIFCGIVVAFWWILRKDLIQANPLQPDERTEAFIFLGWKAIGMSKAIGYIIVGGTISAIYVTYKTLNRSQTLPTVKYGCGSDGGLFTPGSHGAYIAEKNPNQLREPNSAPNSHS
ncbi:uncharacterized protein LOC110862282 isoform X1 [Folsomia candida]|uniref:Transmembrane protein n=1 Tax=Folsomia candida TaxID=158441 RepID=A0A226CY26_FOLCA|nr:uncharacterized protein LOC110862282 isoform X1 [Folsomia candida]OXA37690.1 hypothetical protein Fcan01_27518 [Folsomia candida]